MLFAATAFLALLGPAPLAPSPEDLAAAPVEKEVAEPADLTPYLPRDLRPYFVAFLVNPPVKKKMPATTFVRHQQYMRGQFENGIYRLAGPVQSEAAVRGLIILEAQSAEEARKIVSADPAIQEGFLAVEIHEATFPSLDALQIHYPERQ